MTLDRILYELKQFLTVDPAEGGTPYAYRFYRPGDLDHDERLDDFQDAPLVEVRAFHSGTYTLTPADETGRHLAAPKPPEMTDAVPMIVGENGVAVPGAIKRPIPDEEPELVQVERLTMAQADAGNIDSKQAMEVLREPTAAGRKSKLRRFVLGD